MRAHAGATPPGATSRRGRRGRWILLVLLAVPLLEILTIIVVGQAVGPWWTFGALIALSIVGAAVVHREGRRTWNRLREALRRGETPARELTDAGLVLIGGALLLTPGFLTDALGFFLVLPFTRPITRAWLQIVVSSRLLGTFNPQRPNGGRRTSSGRSAAGQDVIEGEIIQDPHQERQG